MKNIGISPKIHITIQYQHKNSRRVIKVDRTTRKFEKRHFPENFYHFSQKVEIA